MPARFDREDRRALRPAGQHDTAAGDRRRNQAPVRDSVRIPRAPAPKFLAIGRVVSGDAVAPGDEQFGPATESERNRRGVGFLGFLPRVVGTNNPPEFLAGLRIEPQQERIDRAVRVPPPMDRHVALQDLQRKAAGVKGRAAAKRPLKRELAVVLLDVARPDLFAVEVERRQFAVAVKEPDPLAVGDRRR